MTMQWSNLEDGNCPQCEHTLENDAEKQRMKCPACEFRISNEKYRNITSNIAENNPRVFHRTITPEEQRQSELNEL